MVFNGCAVCFSCLCAAFQVRDSMGHAAHLVRMSPYANYHRDAAAPTIELLRRLGVQYRVLGGG